MHYLIIAIILTLLGLACSYLLMLETIKYKRQSMRYQKTLNKQAKNN